MLLPRIFGEKTVDDLWDFPFKGFGGNNMMSTDIREVDGNYELTMDLPGFKKEDVKASLKDGYLTINAATNRSNDEKDEHGGYIRRERYSGSCSRSFYVGEDVTETDIKAKFEDGILKITVPKKDSPPAVEENKYINIEG